MKGKIKYILGSDSGCVGIGAENLMRWRERLPREMAEMVGIGVE